MNIYWFAPIPSGGGGDFARALLEDGDRLTVHTLANGRKREGVRDHRVEVLDELPNTPRLPEGSWVWAGSRLTTYVKRAVLRERVIRRGFHDVCHVRFLNLFTDWWALRRLSRLVPLVSTVHDVVPHDHRLPSGTEVRLLSAVYRNAGRLVVAHEDLRGMLVERFHVDPRLVDVVPLPIPEVVRDDSPAPGPPVVLFFGSLRRNKGIEILLDAIRSMPDQVTFQIAGQGHPEIEGRIRRAALADRRIRAEVGARVSRERKADLFRRATLMVLPYTSFASQSGVLRDACAYRVPVVATDVGALGPSIEQHGLGWVVPAGDAGALARTLTRALSDGEGRRAAAAAAGRVASEQGGASVAPMLRAVYERAVRGWGVRLQRSGTGEP